MKLSTLIPGLALVGASIATQSLCNKYTTALFGSNTEAHQQLLLHKLVNTAVIGNYSAGALNAVPGILAPGTYNGENVNLLQYFDGELASSNRGGKCGVAINFLDGGGAAPLMNDKAANCRNCNQFFLLTHLYKFFAALLGCSVFGNTVKPYDGFNGMYQVHKFMALDAAEVGYFIQQVGLAATSFGVSQSDAAAVGQALMALFGYRCAPATSVPSFEPAALQSICTACDCPKASPADCGDYGPVIEPKPAGSSSSWCGSKGWKSSWKWCSSHHS
ncbi:uncharacterized protein LTR77_011226 [Saxophila tyrrhenica]|uniref:Uncharacterized protein n=1 Tax=Saxophila tyrrhenica TaxID=1690608 RepID=A0AAV9NVS5_9PEZI|nr:hypothetical protein LTR77_011226 [Saxophila tyrrhenica]